MIQTVTVSDILSLPPGIPVADVRTPDEFAHGHIPGAVNLPIFSNEERVRVGTTYKQVGHDEAVLLGFEITGPKWAGFIREALGFAPSKKIALHCWRGGMRSGAMAWALDFYGFDVYLLQGGYKSYRSWVQSQFSRPFTIRVIGGKTGSGKTALLRQLQQMDERVIDLEELAQHQGSSFGSLNRMVQPTQEQFENNLALRLAAFPDGSDIWVEDESIAIGKRFIPRPFWDQMLAADLYDIRIKDEYRVQQLVEQYGPLDKDFLVDCTQRIWKRLGHERTANAIAALREDRMADFVRHVLVYYDKTYNTAISMRVPASVIPVPLEPDAGCKDTAAGQQGSGAGQQGSGAGQKEAGDRQQQETAAGQQQETAAGQQQETGIGQKETAALSLLRAAGKRMLANTCGKVNQS